MDPEVEDAPEEKVDTRDRELCGRAKIREKLLDLYDDIEAGFVAQADRSNNIMDYWDAYKCALGGAQYYNGNAKVFFPIIPNAIRARTTRFTNQCFPTSGRYVDVTTANGDIPYAEMALMEHYIRRQHLKNTIVKPLFKTGDIEGNYSVYVDWKSRTRKATHRAERAVMDEDEERPDFGAVTDMRDEDVIEEGPDVHIIMDSDLLILPATAKTIDHALDQGGSVCIRRRWTKATIKVMIEEGDIDKKAGEAFLTAMREAQDQPGRRDVSKKIGEAAGIRVHKGIKTAVVCETWTKLKVDGEHVLCRAYFGGDDIILGCKRNPYWNDKCPVITEPVDRDPTGIKGRPPAADVLDLQIAANDMVNEALDVSNFAAMPIVAADPEKNPHSSTMILGLGAVWDVAPEALKFLEFPALYEKLLPFIQQIETTIFQTLGVNPSMIPQSTGKAGAKRNQAEIAMEQQIDILTTAESVSVMEDVLNQILSRFVDYDHQFRDKPARVRAFGPMGRKANMIEIAPIQNGAAYEFTWLGVEAARNTAMAQQQIAALATLMKIPPQTIPDYKLDLSAALQSIVLTQFGPRIAPLTLRSIADEQTIPPEEENEMLDMGYELTVHPGDDDVKHIQVHMQDLQALGDPTGHKMMHLNKHNMQRQAKATAAAQAQQQQGAGGGRPPQPGAQPGGARPNRGPPGTIPQDRIPGQMPRKT